MSMTIATSAQSPRRGRLNSVLWRVRQFASGGRDIIGTMYFPVFDFLRSTIVGTTLF